MGAPTFLFHCYWKKRWQNLETMSTLLGKKLKLLYFIQGNQTSRPGPSVELRSNSSDMYIFIFLLLVTYDQEEGLSSFGTYSKSQELSERERNSYSKSQELSETEKEIAEFVVFYDLSCSKRYLIIYLVHFRHVGHSL